MLICCGGLLNVVIGKNKKPEGYVLLTVLVIVSEREKFFSCPCNACYCNLEPGATTAPNDTKSRGGKSELNAYEAGHICFAGAAEDAQNLSVYIPRTLRYRSRNPLKSAIESLYL